MITRGVCVGGTSVAVGDGPGVTVQMRGVGGIAVSVGGPGVIVTGMQTIAGLSQIPLPPAMMGKNIGSAMALATMRMIAAIIVTVTIITLFRFIVTPVHVIRLPAMTIGQLVSVHAADIFQRCTVEMCQNCHVIKYVAKFV